MTDQPMLPGLSGFNTDYDGGDIMGGKPSKGTSKDRRLKQNKTSRKSGTKRVK